MIKLKQKIESFNMSNSKLSNLLGKNHDYISDILRAGTSTANQNKLMQALDNLMDEMNEQDVPRVTVAYRYQEVRKLKLKNEELDNAVSAYRISFGQLKSQNFVTVAALNMAERDKEALQNTLKKRRLFTIADRVLILVLFTAIAFLAL